MIRDRLIQRPRPEFSWRATLWVVILGMVGTALWEMFVRPGLSHGGRVFLTLFTLGSSTIRDYAYANAALDPFPLASVLLLLGVLTLPIYKIMTASFVIRDDTVEIQKIEENVRRLTRRQVLAADREERAVEEELSGSHPPQLVSLAEQLREINEDMRKL